MILLWGGEPGAARARSRERLSRRPATAALPRCSSHRQAGQPTPASRACCGSRAHLGGNAVTRAGWEHVRARTPALLADQRDTLALVIDEPSTWGAAGGLFARRAEEAIETLSGPNVACRVVICDQGRSSSGVRLPGVDRADLASGTWGIPKFCCAGAVGSSDCLAASYPPATASSRRPIRLGTGAVRADSLSLGTQLARALSSRRHGAPLWALWQRLALARVPTDAATLSALGGERLSELASATLLVALLDGGDVYTMSCAQFPRIDLPNLSSQPSNEAKRMSCFE